MVTPADEAHASGACLLRPPAAQDMSHRGEGNAVLATSQFFHNLPVSLNNTNTAKNLKLTQVEHACSAHRTTCRQMAVPKTPAGWSHTSPSNHGVWHRRGISQCVIFENAFTTNNTFSDRIFLIGNAHKLNRYFTAINTLYYFFFSKS